MRYPIPVFFVSFVLFTAFLAFKRRKQTENQQNANESFMDRERLANSTRKQDISNLDYLSFSLEALPVAAYDDDELHSHETILKNLAGQKILNLSMYSNTDLKLMYGPANLETLSACDDNYHTLSVTLLAYAEREVALNRLKDAIGILEYAMKLHIDSSRIYLLLADLYEKQHTPEKIRDIVSVLSAMEASESEKEFASRMLPKIKELAP